MPKQFLFFLLISLGGSVFAQQPFPITAEHGVTKERIDTYVHDRAGQKVMLKDYMKKGKVYLVSVWATWCGPCRRELNAINEIHKTWLDKYDVEIIALSTDRPNSASKVWRMADQNKWDFTIYHDLMGYVGRELEVFQIPQTFLVDQQGNIAYKTKGFTSSTMLIYEEKIRALKQ